MQPMCSVLKNVLARIRFLEKVVYRVEPPKEQTANNKKNVYDINSIFFCNNNLIIFIGILTGSF